MNDNNKKIGNRKDWRKIISIVTMNDFLHSASLRFLVYTYIILTF